MVCDVLEMAFLVPLHQLKFTLEREEMSFCCVYG